MEGEPRTETDPTRQLIAHARMTIQESREFRLEQMRKRLEIEVSLAQIRLALDGLAKQRRKRPFFEYSK